MPEENFILKLFDTLREAIRDMNNTLKELLNNQHTLGEYMKSLPIRDLKESLKDHSKESNENIDTCTETVTLQSGDILKGIQSIKDILVRTIITVSVFFGIITSGWFYDSFIKPDKLPDTIIQLQQQIKKEKIATDKLFTEQNKVIQELRKTIKELHN